MMRKLSTPLPAIALLFVVGACGGDDDAQLPPSSGIPIEALPAEYASAICDATIACMGSAYTAFVKGQDCEVFWKNAIEDSEFSRFEQAIADGRVTYDPAAMAACLESIRRTSCDAFATRDRPECTAAIGGTVNEGGACSINAECNTGTFCKLDQACPGTCTAYLPAGEPCVDDDNCATGLNCSEDTRRCTANAGTGEPCGGNVSAECKPGDMCLGADEDTGTAGNCRAIDETFTAQDGETCDLTNGPLCAEGLFCVIEGVSATGVEAKCTATATSGDGCKLAIPDACPDTQYCKLEPEAFTGTCTTLPSSGEPCGGLFQACEPYTVCEKESNMCHAVERLGGSCAGDSMCYSGRCEGGVCVASNSCS